MTNSSELYDFGLALSMKLNEKFPSAVKKAKGGWYNKQKEEDVDKKSASLKTNTAAFCSDISLSFVVIVVYVPK